MIIDLKVHEEIKDLIEIAQKEGANIASLLEVAYKRGGKKGVERAKETILGAIEEKIPKR